MQQQEPRSRRQNPKQLRRRQVDQVIQNLIDALHNAKKVAVVGVGSELRGDDIAGVLIARKIDAWCKRNKITSLGGFVGGSAPENITSEIFRFQPSHLVLVDAAHLGKEPGAIEIIPAERIEGVSFSTHMLPARIFLDYLEKNSGCQSLVVGIEPKGMEVMAKPSAPVMSAVRKVVEGLKAVAANLARVSLN